MIRECKENFTVTVVCKDGRKFESCDVPGLNFLSETSKLISFWVGDSLRTYPMEAIEYFEIVETVPSEEKKL